MMGRVERHTFVINETNYSSLEEQLQPTSSKATSKCPVGQERKTQIDEAVSGLVPETYLKRWPVTLQARQPKAGGL